MSELEGLGSGGEKKKKKKEGALISGVVTQNVDSLHHAAHPGLETVELHGYLRAVVCVHCHREFPRAAFQEDLIRLNPVWADFLAEMKEKGALASEDPEYRRRRGWRANPDGDVDVPGAPYGMFRYPACEGCLSDPNQKNLVRVDGDGAMVDPGKMEGGNGKGAGVLKPAVVMFGEGVNEGVKKRAEEMVDQAARVLVLGSSLATYSAWRLVRRAVEGGKGVGVVNLGGVRGEEGFFSGDGGERGIGERVRLGGRVEEVLVGVVEKLGEGR